ncbi:14047_t:CDS:1 [Funneliformis geosporum]|uniref:14047_t:CDS:1 n=1 Tax=Funneliformis geosporum TaxID=1117311 RepID=A0A9W4SXW8_9GLOM|nr:14047_t:CDS:1 [Funneliformis geosporum]
MNKKSKQLQTKFTNTLKTFANKIEETKQNQQQILADFALTQSQENSELTKIAEQTKSKEETMAVVQNAVNLVEQQIEVREEINQILKEEVKASKEAVKSLIANQKVYMEQVHQEINK